jgi:hypothetical protein
MSASEPPASFFARHLPSTLPPLPLSEEQKQAGTLILKNWRNFVAQRNNVPDAARNLARAMGEQVTNDNHYKALLKDGRIIVQINGESGDSTRGHSAIYHDFMKHELQMVRESRPGNQSISKYGMSEQAVKYFNEKFRTTIYSIGSRSIITQELAFSSDLSEVTRKGNLFVLHKDFSKNFDEALRQATEQFHNGPYSWGLNYNCNVFIFDFLKKLRNLVE